MNTISRFSTGKGSTDDKSKDSTASEHGANRSGCGDNDFRIDCRGDVNIYNCSTPSGTGTTPPPTCAPCVPPYGACLPVVPGAKHKLSREYKLTQACRSGPRAELARGGRRAHGAPVSARKDCSEPAGSGGVRHAGSNVARHIVLHGRGLRRSAAASTQSPVRSVPHPRPKPAHRPSNAVGSLGAGDRSAGRRADLRRSARGGSGTSRAHASLRATRRGFLFAGTNLSRQRFAHGQFHPADQYWRFPACRDPAGLRTSTS